MSWLPVWFAGELTLKLEVGCEINWQRGFSQEVVAMEGWDGHCHF